MNEQTPIAHTSSASAPPSAELVAGRYLRGRTIARSEETTLHEALHVVTGRRVALRLSHDASASSHALQRQAVAVGAIRHTNVVDVYDAGDLADGRSFLALELLEGKSLDAILTTRGALGPIETAWIGVEVAAGLAAAHASGIAHRDVRPRNIVIVRGQGGGDALKIIGFGNAADFTEPVPGARHSRRVPSPFAGAPEYVPPERLERSGPIDGRGDAYALAAMLHELLVGVVPFLGTAQEILSKMAEHERAPIPCTSAPLGLGLAIARGLARDPSARFPSLRAFLGALAVHAHGPRPSLLPPLGSDVDPMDVDVTEDEARASLQPPPLPHARRRAARAPFVAPISIVHDQGTTAGVSEDLSEGGMLVLVSRSFPNDVDAVVRFVPPGLDHEIEVRAAVRWMRTARLQVAFGIEFIDPPPALTKAVAAWVSRREKGER